MKLAEAFENFRMSKIGVDKPSTITWYEQRLKSLIKMYGDVELENITPEALDRWRAKLASRKTRYEDHPTRPCSNTRGLSVHTLHGHIRACRTFFRFCCRRGYIDKNPAEDLKRPRLPKEPPKHITDVDIDRLLLAATDNPRDYAFIIVLAATGGRIGGFVGLTWDHVDLENGAIEIHEKFDKTNEYYLTEQALQALRYWSERCPREHNAVFPTPTGEPLTYDGLYQILKRCAKKGGVKGRWNPHSFRHHKARELLDNGASLDAVADLLKHEDVSTTAQFYGRWTKEEMRQKYQRYSRKHYPGTPQDDEQPDED